MENLKETYFEKSIENAGILGGLIEQFAKKHPEEFIKSANYHFIKVLFNCNFEYYGINDEKLQKLVNEVLEELEPTEKQLLRTSFGLDNGKIIGFEAAQELNITAEEAEILMSNIFRKLRQPDRTKALKEFLKDRLELSENQND